MIRINVEIVEFLFVFQISGLGTSSSHLLSTHCLPGNFEFSKKKFNKLKIKNLSKFCFQREINTYIINVHNDPNLHKLLVSFNIF